MRIVFDELLASEKAIIERELSEHSLTFLDAKITDTTVLPNDTAVLSVFVGSKVTREHIQALPELRGIAARSMGLDHIDTVAAKERSIPVMSVAGYGTNTVAEFALALMLALSRKAFPAYQKLRDARIVDVVASEGFDLCGKTLAVIGTGKIGKNLARYGKALGMTVLLYDVSEDAAFANEIQSTYVPLDTCITRADVLSIHVPLLESTAHLFNAEHLAQCKQGAVIINTSRGGVIDTIALKSALESGHIGGAGLDVFEGEHELFGTHTGDTPQSEEARAAAALLTMPNVIMTPHVAYNTKEAKAKILETSIANIRTCLAADPRTPTS